MRQEVQVGMESLRADRITLGECAAQEEVSLGNTSMHGGMASGGEMESLLSLAGVLQKPILFYP